MLLPLAGLNACGGSAGDAVAQVGGTSITKSMFDHWMSLGGAPLSVATSNPNAVRQQTLGFLIASAQTIGQASELRIGTSDKQVKRELEGLRYREIYGTPDPSAKEAELRKLLAIKGETQADQLWIVKVGLLAAKVQQKHMLEAQAKLTQAQVAQYYGAHKQLYVAPERRDIQAIMTYHLGPLKAAKREIEAGKNFMSVANRVNEEPDEAGLRLGLTRGHQKKRYLRDYFAAPAHVLVGPLKEILYYIFEVRRIVPARQQTLAEVEERVKQQLITGQQRQLLTGVLDAFASRWNGKTSCRHGYLARQCKQSAGK